MTNRLTSSEDLNVLGLQKEGEYFRDDGRAEAQRALGRFAANPDLIFSWYDAAVLSQRIREITHNP